MHCFTNLLTSIVEKSLAYLLQGIQSSSNQFFISVRYVEYSSLLRPLPLTALCQLQIIDKIFAPLTSPFYLRKETTAGEISLLQQTVFILFISNEDQYPD